MIFTGTKVGVCDMASVTEFLKRITSFTHLLKHEHNRIERKPG
jgi:DNA-binding transcriptional regulator WhiA